MAGEDAPGPPQQSNMQALLEALDQRARQQGAEGATTVMKGMLGTIADVLSGIDSRLDELGASATRADVESTVRGATGPVAASIADVAARLARLEQAFAGAVEDSGDAGNQVVRDLEAVVRTSMSSYVTALEDLRQRQEAETASVREAIAELAAAVQGAAPPPVSFDPVLARLDALEASLPDTASTVSDIEAVVRTAMSAYVESLDDLRRRQQAEAESLRAAVREVGERVAQQEPRPAVSLEPVLERLDGIDARIGDPAAVEALVRSSMGLYVESVDDLRQRQQREGETTRAAMAELADRLADQAPPIVSLAPVLDRMASLEQQLADLVTAVAAPRDDRGLDEVLAKLDEVQALAGRVAEATPQPVDLTPVLDRLDALATRGVDFGPVHTHLAELAERLPPSADLQPLHDHIDHLTEQVHAIADAPRPEVATAAQVQDAVSALVPQLDRVAMDLGELQRRPVTDVGRLEELATGLRGLDQKLDEHAASAGALAAAVEELTARVQQAEERASEAAGAIASAHLPGSLAGLTERVEAVLAAVTRPAPPPAPGGPSKAELDALAEQVIGTVRRESELLTQRVAALSLTADAMSVLLDAHVDDTAQSLGRKASEVGRKLAADLGFKQAKARVGQRPDPREIGPGGHSRS